jgi:hypothetical protein
MKTVKLTSAIATLGIVLFMSVAALANSGTLKTGNLSASGDRSLNISGTIENDFSYLRFDANKYMNENEEADAIVDYLDYLRFDASKFINENESEITELPETDEFEYLRFDADNFTEANPDATIELPVSEFNYLRFDANNFVSSNNSVIDELPVTE